MPSVVDADPVPNFRTTGMGDGGTGHRGDMRLRNLGRCQIPSSAPHICQFLQA